MTQGTVRPGGGWYAAAAILFVLAIIAAVIGVVLIVNSASNSGPRGIGSGTTLTLTPTKDQTIYASQPGTSSGSPCRANGPGQATFTQPVGSQRITVNGQSWYAVADVHVDVSGTYNLSCDAGQYAIGDKGAVFGFVGSIFAAIALFFGGGLLGLVAVVILLVTLIRRSLNRRRAAPPYPYA